MDIPRALQAAVLLTSSVTSAEKDSTYLPYGSYNPNINDEMYWNDSLDILKDLDQFDRLYVRYHNCATSPFGGTIPGYQKESFERYWYLGLTQQYRANVAFSVYGILKGQRDRGCQKATFINSFFTRHGVQSFVQALKIMGYLGGDLNDAENDIFAAGGGDDEYAHPGFSSVCFRYLSDDDNGEFKLDYSPAVLGDPLYPNYSPALGDILYPGAISYTLACTPGGGFQIESYHGAACDRNAHTGSYVNLDDVNGQLEDLRCALLYDSTQSRYYSDDTWIDSYNWASEQNIEEADYFQEQVPQVKYPLDLLKYSQSCSVRLNPTSCPDPYGKVAQYTENFYRGTNMVVSVDSPNSYLIRMSAPVLLGLSAVFMFCFARNLETRTRRKSGAQSDGKPYIPKSDDDTDDSGSYDVEGQSTLSDKTESVVSETAGHESSVGLEQWIMKKLTEDRELTSKQQDAKILHDTETKTKSQEKDSKPKPKPKQSQISFAPSKESLLKKSPQSSKVSSTMPARLPSRTKTPGYVSPSYDGIKANRTTTQDPTQQTQKAKVPHSLTNESDAATNPASNTKTKMRYKTLKIYRPAQSKGKSTVDSSEFETKSTEVPQRGSAKTVTRSASKSVHFLSHKTKLVPRSSPNNKKSSDEGSDFSPVPVMAVVASDVKSEITIDNNDFPKKQRSDVDRTIPSPFSEDSIALMLTCPPRVPVEPVEKEKPSITGVLSQDSFYSKIKSPPHVTHKNPKTKPMGVVAKPDHPKPR